ncbi:MAG TPA: PilW family protein [Ramlibacter sp.]|nr:PilW family protein [Ramlibacter sp.]
MIELCVGLALSIVVVGALLVSYLSSAESGRQARALTQMTEDAQTAMMLLRRDIQAAGSVAPTAIDAATGRFQARWSFPAVFGCDTGFLVPKANFNDVACAAKGAPGIALSFEASPDTAIYGGSPAGPLDCTGTRITEATAPTGSKGFFTSHRYFVDKGPGGRNELYCASQDSSPDPLVDGVQALKFTYGVADGWVANDMTKRRAVRYVSATNVTAAQWSAVVAVRICMLMRSEHTVPNAAEVANYIDCDSVAQKSADGRLYRAFYSTVAVRNLGAF